MSASINELTYSKANLEYIDNHIWETTLHLIEAAAIEENTFTTIDISGATAQQYKYDFIGLCMHFNIDRAIIYPIMRLNGYKNHTEYTAQSHELKIKKPAPEYLVKIITIVTNA